MKNLINYLYESYYPFKLVYLDNLIIEREITKYHTHPTIYTSDHCDKREVERKVTDQEIRDAIMGAYRDINKLYMKGYLLAGNLLEDNGKRTRFCICDSRKNKNVPVCVVGGIRVNNNPDELENPIIEIYTVFRGQDFAALRRPQGKNHDDYGTYYQYNIFLTTDIPFRSYQYGLHTDNPYKMVNGEAVKPGQEKKENEKVHVDYYKIDDDTHVIDIPKKDEEEHKTAKHRTPRLHNKNTSKETLKSLKSKINK